jgi:ADP-ribose pyrophosphatase
MPFTTLKREQRYKAHVFDVAQIQVRLPDGRERNYDLVEHGDSVTILPIDSEENIYFVTQHRVGADGDLLELPAGVLNKNEDPIKCAQRELREEIGMDAHSIEPLGGFYLAPGYSDEYMHVFLASGLFNSPLDPDDDEFLNVTKMLSSDVYKKAFAAELQDGKTLAALLLAIPIIERK